MIVSKIMNENGTYVPDIPEELEYESAIYRQSTDDYLVTFTPQQLEQLRITPAQGRAQLAILGKLNQIDTFIQQSDDEQLKIFWEYSTFWDKTTPIIKLLGAQFSIDIDQMWADAKEIVM